MRKRLLAVLLCLCMAATFLPGTAWAAGDGVLTTEEARKVPCTSLMIDGVVLDATNQYYKNGDTPDNKNGSENDWNAKFEPATGSEDQWREATLRLNGLNIADGQVRMQFIIDTTTAGEKYEAESGYGNLRVVVEGENTVTYEQTATSNGGIERVAPANDMEGALHLGDLNSTLTFSGNGSLTCTGKWNGITHYGDIIIEGGIITSNGTGRAGVETGVYTLAGEHSNLTVKGGKLSASGRYPILVWNNFTVTGGEVSASEVSVDRDLKVSGGVLHSSILMSYSANSAYTDRHSVEVSGSGQITGGYVTCRSLTIKDNASVETGKVTADEVTLSGNSKLTAKNGFEKPFQGSSFKTTVTLPDKYAYKKSADGSFEMGGFDYATSGNYVELCCGTSMPEIHIHTWASDWTTNATHHWHNCTVADCPVTDNSEKDSYGAHVYTDDADATCNVCGYEREVTTEPEAPAISNISYNYSTGALTWTGKNIPVTDHTNGYFWIQTFDSEGNEVDGSGRECMETNVHEAGIQVTKSGDTYSCTYKPVTLADGNYKIVIECRVPGGSTVSYSFTLPQSTTPDTPSTPSGGGSYIPPSSTTTETTKNPDGSTTTKTENKTTGTVTETTKNTDGSTTKVETKKDGTVTTTQTDATGNKTETVAKPDGSSVTKVNQKDGTKATVNTDTEGKVEAEVTLPKQAVAAAQENEQPIMLPVPRVEAAASAEAAPVVTVKTGSDEPVKVLIPTTEAKPGTVAVIVKENGTEEIVKTSVSTADGLAVSLPDGATVKVVDNSKTFADVPASNWAADAVSFSTARELFSGTSESSFSPEQPMTRAMMVTVLARFDGADTSGGNTWYEQGVNWAVSKGISDGSNPNGNISREQLAVMLWRYAGSPAPTGGLEDFHDAGSVSDYAQEAMRWAVESGIVNGNGSGALLPQGEATRAQVAQMLKNFIEMQ